jgi:hypothetical protein
MRLPDDDEMLRMFRAHSEHDPQMVRDIIQDPSRSLLFGNVHHDLHDIVHGESSGEENRWYLIPEAQAWVRAHRNDITPSEA